MTPLQQKRSKRDLMRACVDNLTMLECNHPGVDKALPQLENLCREVRLNRENLADSVRK